MHFHFEEYLSKVECLKVSKYPDQISLSNFLLLEDGYIKVLLFIYRGGN